MSSKRCNKCNRKMGYKPPSDLCAPCEFGFNEEPKPEVVEAMKSIFHNILLGDMILPTHITIGGLHCTKNLS